MNASLLTSNLKLPAPPTGVSTIVSIKNVPPLAVIVGPSPNTLLVDDDKTKCGALASKCRPLVAVDLTTAPSSVRLEPVKW